MQSAQPPTQVRPVPPFLLEGKPFCFHGANNYYLHHKPRAAVLEVLDAARSMELKVLRTWAFLDRGSLDESRANAKEPGHAEGVYFQYWDEALARPAFNDGANGLQHLDFVLHAARERGLKLILVLTNNWRDFGGMDQYLIWFGLTRHHEFYGDDRVRAAYKDWVMHLVSRQNSIDGMLYSEDPAIFGWELANEPRTINFGAFDSAEGWNTSTLIDWASEMSLFIQGLDPNHLVSVGDEGFLDGGGQGWPYQAAYGVDHKQLTSLPSVDFGTFHLYPEHWGQPKSFGESWINAHLELARAIRKPTLLEEYGVSVQRSDETSGEVVSGLPARKSAYTNWSDALRSSGGAGGLFWLLSGHDGAQLYPDFDHFTVYPHDESALLLEKVATLAAHNPLCTASASPLDAAQESPFVRVAGP